MKLINDVTFPEYPSIKDCILYEDKNEVIFQLKHLVDGCASTGRFIIFVNSVHSSTIFFTLSRWDNTGGWKRIFQHNYQNMETAKQHLIPLAKYFV